MPPRKKAARSATPAHTAGSGRRTVPFDEVWNGPDGLHAVAKGILEMDKPEMPKDRYLEISALVMDHCTHSDEDTSIMGYSIGSTVAAAPASPAANLVGGQKLYRATVEVVRQRALDIRAQLLATESPDDLMAQYALLFKNFTLSSKLLASTFHYLMQHYLNPMRQGLDGASREAWDPNRPQDLKSIALVMWKLHVLEEGGSAVEQRVVAAVTEQLNMIRDGNVGNLSLTKAVVDSMVRIGGVDRIHPMAIYVRTIEARVLVAAEEYFKADTARLLQNCTIPDYMQAVLERMQPEKKRLEKLVHSSTVLKVMKIMDHTMIFTQREAFCEAFPGLLQDLRVRDIGAMFTLLNKLVSDEPIERMVGVYETFVYQSALDAVQAVKDQPKADEAADLARAYVEALINVYERFNGINEDAFGKDMRFTRAVDKACRNAVNRNAIAKTARDTPELLCKYVDKILRRNPKNPTDDELERRIDTIMVVFHFIEDKDVFLKYYSSLLAVRFIKNTSQSEDMESAMITRLREACGHLYAAKLQSMVQDMSIREEMVATFRKERTNSLEALKENSGDNFDFLVLGSARWPITQPKFAWRVPDEVNVVLRVFEDWYAKAHTGRKLSWIPVHSTVDVLTSCFDKRYTFVLNFVQCSILCAFNGGRDRRTFEEVCDVTSLPMDVATTYVDQMVSKFRTLAVLDDAGGRSHAAGAELAKDTVLVLNPKFRHKKIRIPLNMAPAKVRKEEDQRTMERVDNDRKYFIQAVVVRIMKARKKLSHTDLMNETIDQIKGRFTPDIRNIKTEIVGLIEKEYLERVEDAEVATYAYLA